MGVCESIDIIENNMKDNTTVIENDNTRLLLGLTKDKADELIKTFEIFHRSNDYKITEIRVVKKNGRDLSVTKDIRRREGRNRLNVCIKDNKIYKIEDVS